MKRKFDETKDKNIVLVLGVARDGKTSYGYNFGVFGTEEEARINISKSGVPNDEYRIFNCKFADRIKVNTKIEHIKEA